jgi:hypothetical protein
MSHIKIRSVYGNITYIAEDDYNKHRKTFLKQYKADGTPKYKDAKKEIFLHRENIAEVLA